jgi:hypothetical protein
MSDEKKMGRANLPPKSYALPKGAEDPAKEEKMRALEESAAQAEIRKLSSSDSIEKPTEERKAKREVPEEFLPGDNRPVSLNIRTTARLSSVLDLVCRKEKELNPKRTKADAINQALAAYANEQLKKFGYLEIPESFLFF